MSQSAALAGFSDPIHDVQRTFRAALEALARPGTRHSAIPPIEQPPGLATAALALAMTLADRDTPVWLGDAKTDTADYLRFHAGCPIVDDPAAAAFALGTAAQLPGLSAFGQGDIHRPDLSTTVIMAVDSLQTGTRLRLAGPGIDGHRLIACAGLPPSFIAQWMDNRARFPCGVDLFLTAGDTFVGLPRTTLIEEA